MLAMLTKAPEFELADYEAKALAGAIANVAQYYDVTGMSAKGLAWYNVAQTVAVVYGPRIVAARNRTKEATAARRRAPPEDMNSGVPRQAQPVSEGMPGPATVDISRFHGGVE